MTDNNYDENIEKQEVISENQEKDSNNCLNIKIDYKRFIVLQFVVILILILSIGLFPFINGLKDNINHDSINTEQEQVVNPQKHLTKKQLRKIRRLRKKQIREAKRQKKRQIRENKRIQKKQARTTKRVQKKKKRAAKKVQKKKAKLAKKSSKKK